VAPVVEGNGAFVEWSATFDGIPGEIAHWSEHLSKEGFGRWLAALRRYMTAAGADPQPSPSA